MKPPSYDVDGFLIARKALTPEECERIDALLKTCPLKTRVDWGVRYATNCIAQCHELSDLMMRSSAVEKYVARPIVYDEIVETLNTSADPYPVHQDAAYFPAASVSLAIALSPLQDKRGGLSVAPGSHSKGLREIVEGHERMELLDLQRGDIVIIHPHLVHTMIGTRTDLPGRMYSVILG